MKKSGEIFFKHFVLPGNTTNSYKVAETASKKVVNNSQKIFSAADLWNIQRRMRTTVIR